MTTSAAVSVSPQRTTTAKVSVRDLHVHYGKFHALKGVTLDVPEKGITSIIGPSGCGKSTLLRCLNRMNDGVRGFRCEGKVLLDGLSIYSGIELTELRKRVGMVFQRPNPFPLSVYENVAYGPRIHGEGDRRTLEAIVERSLRATGLWEGLKDRMRENALGLSAEQQQRLCISRLLAVEPEVLLMDEPCSALDPIATATVEELMQTLKKDYTIVIVTHNMQQAARASDSCGFMWLGELVEFADTQDMFTTPRHKLTEQYVTGRIG